MDQLSPLEILNSNVPSENIYRTEHIMKKLVIILLFVLTQVSWAQWEPCNKVQMDGGVIISIDINDEFIFASTTKGGVFRSGDDCKNWSACNSGLSNLYLTCMVIKGNIIFIGTYGGGVYLSNDNGESWIPKNGGLTNMDIISLVIKGNYMFIGSEGGVFLSTDNGDNWSINDLSKFLLARKDLQSSELNEVYKFAISNNPAEIQKDDFSILKLHFY